MLLLALLALIPQADSSLRLPSLVGDHMVLQRGTQARVWGWAQPGDAVAVLPSWTQKSAAATADAAGRWAVMLDTPNDQPGPHTVRIESPHGSRTLNDVMLGEVWVCGGQSNMEWTLGPGVGNGVAGGAEAAAAANDPNLRWFGVAHAVSMTPLEDCAGAWQVCTPEVAPRMSAVGFFFGAALLRELPGVPIALIGCNWGGTLAEAWTSEEFLAARGDFEVDLARMRAARQVGASTGGSVVSMQKAWWEKLEETDPGSQAHWNRTELDDSGWEAATLPGSWSGALAGHDGVVWYRRNVTIPQDWVQRDLVVELGPIDDCDTFWADGERWGATHQDGAWQTPRQYHIAAKLVDDTQLQLALRVVDTGGIGGLSGPPEVMRIYRQNHAESSIALAGAWKMKPGATMSDLGEFPRQAWFHQNSPTALYNGMLAPVTRHTIRGAIFYQGESNVGRWWQYRTLFPDMVRAWRFAWGQGEFPFYWVQIAPYNYGAGEKLSRLREAQTLALTAIPRGGMAVTTDIGDPGNIHPVEKRTVGERLARWALAGPYGRKNVVTSGPLLRSVEARGAEMILHFEHATGLCALDGKALLNFTVAGADGVFHSASARIEGETVVVSSADVPTPAFVRHAWGEADAANFGNGAGLPAPSFRSDDLPER